jgi:hypothetical protein
MVVMRKKIYFVAFLIIMMLCLPAVIAGPAYRNFTVAVYARAYEVRQMNDIKWLEPYSSIIILKTYPQPD